MNTARTGASRPLERNVAFERIDLSAKSIAPHRHIDPAQRQRRTPVSAGVQDLTGQQDHAGTRPVGGQPVGQPRPQRLEQVEVEQQVTHRGGFPAGYHQPVDRIEFGAAAHRHRVGAGFAQCGKVLAGVALQSKHADERRTHSGAGWYPRLKRVSPSCITAATISPLWLKILPWHSERPPPAEGEDWS